MRKGQPVKLNVYINAITELLSWALNPFALTESPHPPLIPPGALLKANPRLFLPDPPKLNAGHYSDFWDRKFPMFKEKQQKVIHEKNNIPNAEPKAAP